MESSQTELERIRWHTVEMDDGLLSLSAARGGQAPLTARQARAGHGSDEGGLWTPRSLFGAVYVGTARHGVPSTAMSRRHGGAERITLAGRVRKRSHTFRVAFDARPLRSFSFPPHPVSGCTAPRPSSAPRVAHCPSSRRAWMGGGKAKGDGTGKLPGGYRYRYRYRF